MKEHVSQTGGNPKGFSGEMMAELSLRNGAGKNPPGESVQIATSTHGVVNGAGHTLPLETTRKHI